MAMGQTELMTTPTIPTTLVLAFAAIGTGLMTHASQAQQGGQANPAPSTSAPSNQAAPQQDLPTTPPGSTPSNAGPSTTAPTKPPITPSEALEICLTQTIIAEGKGANSREAFQRAQQYLSFVLKDDPENLRGQYLHARLLILAEQPSMAMKPLERWINSQQGADDWEAQMLLGRIYVQGQAYKLAKPHLLRAQELNPTSPIPMIELAKCEAHLKDYPNAIQHLKSAVEKLGTDVTAAAYMIFGQTLLQAGLIDDADRAAGFGVQLAMTAVQRSGTAQALKTLDDALSLSLQVSTAALKADPSRGELYLKISQILQQRAQVGIRRADHEALAISLQGVQSLGEGAPIVLVIEVSRLLAKVGHRQQAMQLVKQVLERAPDNADAQKIFDALKAANPPQTPATNP